MLIDNNRIAPDSMNGYKKFLILRSHRSSLSGTGESYPTRYGGTKYRPLYQERESTLLRMHRRSEQLLCCLLGVHRENTSYVLVSEWLETNRILELSSSSSITPAQSEVVTPVELRTLKEGSSKSLKMPSAKYSVDTTVDLFRSVWFVLVTVCLDRRYPR